MFFVALSTLRLRSMYHDNDDDYDDYNDYGDDGKLVH